MDILVKGHVFNINTPSKHICTVTAASEKTVKRAKLKVLASLGLDFTELYPGALYREQLLKSFSEENLDILYRSMKELSYWKTADYTHTDDELMRQFNCNKSTVVFYRSIFCPEKAKKERVSNPIVAVRLSVEEWNKLTALAKSKHVTHTQLVRTLIQ